MSTINPRKLATDIVSACKLAKKTSQSIILKAITEHMGYRSIQAAESTKLTENSRSTNIDLEQKIEKLRELQEAILTIQNLSVFESFDITQLIDKYPKINPESSKIEDFNAEFSDVVSVIFSALLSYQQGNKDAFSISHTHIGDNANGDDMYHTELNFYHEGDHFTATVEIEEHFYSNDGYEYSISTCANVFNEELVQFKLLEAFELNDFFESICLGDIHVPHMPNIEEIKKAKSLIDSNIPALLLLK